MSANDTMPSDPDLLTARMGDLAREIGEMDPDDPGRAMRVKELYMLTEISRSGKTERNKIMDKEIGATQMSWLRNNGQCSAMHLMFRLPLSEYENFVKALDPSSRAAEILKNACLQRDMHAAEFERFMEITCTEEERNMLLDLANRYYPAAATLISRLETT
jgi:hypothetical protein